MRKFTPTEIDLCKKIAEKERNETVSVDYWLDRNGKPELASGYVSQRASTLFIPLWQEHDCLEFLKEKDLYHPKIS